MKKTAPTVNPDTGIRADSVFSPAVDLPDFGPALIPVDRSTLERYAGCCALARNVELGRVIDRSRAADIGNEIHAAYAETTAEYLRYGLESTPDMLADTFRGRLLQSRPDIQPEVLDAAYHAAWNWAVFLCGKPRHGGGIHPKSIEGFDNGEEFGKSGQLAADFPEYGCTFTGGLDFLYRGPAPDTLHLRDYKSGRKRFSATSVYGSFQFQSYAFLIFTNYPDVSRIETTIEATRTNDSIGPVVFHRDDLANFRYRIEGAIRRWKAYQGCDAESLTKADCLPSRETCPICPAVRVCPMEPPWSVAHDPQGAAVALYALEAQAKSLRAELTEFVEENGEIQGDICFGFDKPVTTKPKPAIYFQGATNDACDGPQDESDGFDAE